MFLIIFRPFRYYNKYCRFKRLSWKMRARFSHNNLLRCSGRCNLPITIYEMLCRLTTAEYYDINRNNDKNGNNDIANYNDKYNDNDNCSTKYNNV